jgi:NTP pyrophosphatase (non-canonical NTP hydrolase)
MDEYQKQALTTVLKLEDPLHNLVHFALGLSGESGEVAEIIKKVVRDRTEIDDAAKAKLTKELGDVLWYIAVFADHLGVSLEELAQQNVDKLKDRQQRNVLSGSGNDR